MSEEVPKGYEMTHAQFTLKQMGGITSEMDKLLEHYKYAETIYGYKNLEQPNSATGIRQTDKPKVISGTSFGILFTWGVTKILTRKSLLEVSCFTKSPARTASLFFYGMFLAKYGAFSTSAAKGTFAKDYQLKSRVFDNRRAHGLMEGIYHKLDVSITSAQTRTDI
mmetsp:Transcript_8842/g.7821  ORF Transcript_8842/g.7821 Transcript_8842/m.7821 type:complete len:166 (+) Transcript_8842:36-533(+)